VARQAPGRPAKPATTRPHRPEKMPQKSRYGKWVSGGDGIGCDRGFVGGGNGAGRRGTLPAGRVARMYADGRGVPQNFVLAHVWYSLSAATAGDFRQLAEWRRTELAKKMTPTQVAEAQGLATAWKPKATP
jgi:hypothetical protein